MRFEKINDNKIRITLNRNDLIKRNIDFHSFMTDSIESQDLFFYCLNKAEKEIGFVTKNYKLHIDAISIPSNDNFIIIITRSLPEKNKYTKKKFHVKNSTLTASQTQAIYCFSSLDDYLSFIYFFKNNNFKFTNLADYIWLYKYNNKYYLVFNNMNLLYPNLQKLLYCVTEFAYYINNSNIFMGKLAENGSLILSHNALRTSVKKLWKNDRILLSYRLILV